MLHNEIQKKYARNDKKKAGGDENQGVYFV
jgi:hypothetical protein